MIGISGGQVNSEPDLRDVLLKCSVRNKETGTSGVRAGSKLTAGKYGNLVEVLKSEEWGRHL